MRHLLLARKPTTLALWAGMALALLALVPATGRADIVLGNLGAGDGNREALGQAQQNAGSFTMGSQAYTLSDVQVRLNVIGSTPLFELRADSSGNPGSSALFTFTNPSFGSGVATYTLNASSSFTLAANTTYWLVGLRSGGGTVNWLASSPDTSPSGSGATFGSFKITGDTRGTWSPHGSNIFQLDGTPVAPVPEPSSLALVATGACVAAAVR